MREEGIDVLNAIAKQFTHPRGICVMIFYDSGVKIARHDEGFFDAPFFAGQAEKQIADLMGWVWNDLLDADDLARFDMRGEIGIREIVADMKAV